MSKGHLIGR